MRKQTYPSFYSAYFSTKVLESNRDKIIMHPLLTATIKKSYFKNGKCGKLLMFPFFCLKDVQHIFQTHAHFLFAGTSRGLLYRDISFKRDKKRILIIVFATKQIKYIFLNFIFLNLFKYFSKCYIVLCHFHSLSVDGKMLS